MDGNGILVVLVLIFAVVVYVKRQAALELQEARARYHKYLDLLKRDPANADLYQKTLHTGRVYSNLTRKRKGVTLYDEAALNNDLTAATAGARRMPQPTIPAPASAVDRMQQLDALKGQGLVTDQEYASSRARILQTL